jgi:hypothetical protein
MTNKVLRDASSAALEALGHPERESLDLDPLMLIGIFRLLREMKLDVAPLRSMIEEVSFQIAGLDSSTAKVGRVRHIAASLMELGFDAPGSSRPRSVTSLISDPGRLLLESSEVISDVVDHLVADRLEIDQDLGMLLALIGLSECRAYNIETATKILRYLIETGIRAPTVTEGLTFIALQRRRNGSYGYIHPERRPDQTDIEVECSFFLPVTFNAISLLMTGYRHELWE